MARRVKYEVQSTKDEGESTKYEVRSTKYERRERRSQLGVVEGIKCVEQSSLGGSRGLKPNVLGSVGVGLLKRLRSAEHAGEMDPRLLEAISDPLKSAFSYFALRTSSFYARPTVWISSALLPPVCW